MNFSTDRDLLMYEPTLFQDVPWASQQRLELSDVQTMGTTLTSESADFALTDIGVGNVVLVEARPYEIIKRLSATELRISQLRARLIDEPIPVAEGGMQSAVIRTFEPQAALVHDQLLHMLGMDPDHPRVSADEQTIVSMASMARLEALGTLQQIFSGAAAVTGDNEGLHQKATQYEHAFRHALHRSTVLLDVDGDGRIDQRRSLASPTLTRV